MRTDADRKWFERKFAALEKQLAELREERDIETLSADEVAPLIGYSSGRSLMTAISTGHCTLPVVRATKQPRFRRRDVARYLESFTTSR